MLLDELAGAPPVKTIWFDSVKDISWPPHAAAIYANKMTQMIIIIFIYFIFLVLAAEGEEDRFARGKIYATLQFSAQHTF